MRGVAIRVHARPKHAHVTWRIKLNSPGGARNSPSWFGADETPNGVFARYFAVSDDKTETFDISVGIASAAWQATGSSSNQNGRALDMNGHSLVFSRGFDAGGYGGVIVSHDHYARRKSR